MLSTKYKQRLQEMIREQLPEDKYKVFIFGSALTQDHLSRSWLVANFTCLVW